MLIISLFTASSQAADHDSISLDNCLSGIAAKDTAALEALYNRTRGAVYGFALSMLKNSHEAEDVLHDCYVSIFLNAEGYKSIGKPMAWIMTIVRNLCYMRFRDKNRSSFIPEEDWQEYITENESLSEEDRFVIRECMMILTQEERNIIVLHALSGMKHREIAQLLDISLPTVLSKYRRALSKLRKILADGEI